MSFKFSAKSYKNLEGVHPNLIRIVERALQICMTDISVPEPSVRKPDQQAKLVKEGRSTTLKSKHLPQADGYGHAVDLYPHPLDMSKVNKGNYVEICRFGLIAQACHAAAQEMGLKIRWGGDWDRDGETLDSSLFDAPHIELVTD